jgi:hypothetical protein
MGSDSDEKFDPNGYLRSQNLKIRKGYDPKNLDDVLEFSGPNYQRKKNICQRCFTYLKLKFFFWSIHSALYFMDDVEGFVFMVLMTSILLLCCYACYYYLPFYLVYISRKIKEYTFLLVSKVKIHNTLL